jgi:hypothetical protein
MNASGTQLFSHECNPADAARRRDASSNARLWDLDIKPNMAATRTYILTPNFHYKPSGPIQIGNIIADPFYPAKALSTIPADQPPVIESVIEYNHELSKEKCRSVGVGFWAQFLQSIGANVNMESGRGILQEYSIEELETRYLRDEPLDDDADLLARVAEPKVQAAIKAGLFGRQPVYMITGLKVARGLSVRTELNKKIGGGIGSTVPVAESVSVGGEVAAERREGIASSFTAGEEAVVFAYQLHKIRLHGRKKNATVGVFESEAAFLHDDEEVYGDEKEVMSVGLSTFDTLVEDEDEDVCIESGELLDDDGSRYVCVSVKGVI